VLVVVVMLRIDLPHWLLIALPNSYNFFCARRARVRRRGL